MDTKTSVIVFLATLLLSNVVTYFYVSDIETRLFVIEKEKTYKNMVMEKERLFIDTENALHHYTENINSLSKDLDAQINSVENKSSYIIDSLEKDIDNQIIKFKKETDKPEDENFIDVNKKKDRYNSSKGERNIEPTVSNVKYSKDDYINILSQQSSMIGKIKYSERKKAFFYKDKRRGSYIGDMHANKPHGCGIYKNNSIFIGQYRKGKRHGFSVEILKNKGKVIVYKYRNGRVIRRTKNTVLTKVSGGKYYGSLGINHKKEIGVVVEGKNIYLNIYKNAILKETICAFHQNI